jgi:hypothetical protein
MSEANAESRGESPWREMTVVQIRTRDDAPYLEVVFLESARFYRLFHENPRYDEILKNLRYAVANRRILKVRFASPNHNTIEDVQPR